MLLTELHGYRRYLDKDFYELMDLLRDNADIDDNGQFSTVVIPHSGDSVYKIWTNDEGYEAWYYIAKRLQGNVFVPKVSRIHKLPIFFKRPDKVDGFLKIVKIERLTPKHIDIRMSSALRSFLEAYMSAGGKMSAEVATRFFEDGKQKVSHIDDLLEVAVPIRQVMINNEGDLTFDLHSSNVMYRGDQPVIIDPFCMNEDREKYQRGRGVLFMNHLSTNIEVIDDAVQRGKFATSNVKTGSRPSTR